MAAGAQQLRAPARAPTRAPPCGQSRQPQHVAHPAAAQSSSAAWTVCPPAIVHGRQAVRHGPQQQCGCGAACAGGIAPWAPMGGACVAPRRSVAAAAGSNGNGRGASAVLAPPEPSPEPVVEEKELHVEASESYLAVSRSVPVLLWRFVRHTSAPQRALLLTLACATHTLASAVRHERHRGARAAGRQGRPQARAPPHPVSSRGAPCLRCNAPAHLAQAGAQQFRER